MRRWGFVLLVSVLVAAGFAGPAQAASGSRAIGAPAVSSKVYDTPDHPGTGGPGVTGRFVLDALGDRDVVGFDYREGDSGVGTWATIAACEPGGRAELIRTPERWGRQRLEVRSFDTAGNRGPSTTYEFWVRDTAPGIEVEMNGVGLTSRLTMHARVEGVTAFGYAIGDGPETRVPAVDGVAVADLVFDRVGFPDVVVRSFAGRRMVGAVSQGVPVTDSPRIASDEFQDAGDPVAGRPGSFTFTPRTRDVVAYRYDFGDGAEQIDAAVDGTAVLPWTPENGGTYYLTVQSVTADGALSEPARWNFDVIDTRPTVWVVDADDDWDGVGRPVHLRLSSFLPGASGFVYSFEGGAEQTVDGAHTTVEVVPAHAGDNTVVARTRQADGSLSPATTFTFRVTSGPLVSVDGPLVIGREAMFTFRPSVPDVVEYHYSFDPWGEDVRTVPAGPDGSATVTFTPAYSWEVVEVTSVAADGSVSNIRRIDFNL